jgi:hypothetical protein
MSPNKFLAKISLVLLLCASACSLPGRPAMVNRTDQDSTVAIQIQVAGIVAETEAAQTEMAILVASTLTAMMTDTPEFTFTPSDTPSMTSTSTPTFTLTPSIPLASVSANTNCRSGPGTIYEIRGVLNIGETAEVVGKNAAGDTWIIKLPSNPSITCWLWGYYATVVGDVSGLTVYSPPPTPTPRLEFTIVSTGTTFEAGWTIWTVDASVENTGGITWQSWQFVMHDNTSGTDLNGIPVNQFPVPPGTYPASEDLNPGEIGGIYVAPLPYDPAGHSLTITVTLCTQDDLAGTCISRTKTFTP